VEEADADAEAESDAEMAPAVGVVELEVESPTMAPIPGCQRLSLTVHVKEAKCETAVKSMDANGIEKELRTHPTGHLLRCSWWSALARWWFHQQRRW